VLLVSVCLTNWTLASTLRISGQWTHQ